MAGTINVNDHHGLALNSIAFAHFVNMLQHRFEEEHHELWCKLSGPLALQILTSRGLSQSEFKIFSQIVRRAYESAKTEHKLEDTEELWKDLLDLIESDPRMA